jgi:hypothetical protein
MKVMKMFAKFIPIVVFWVMTPFSPVVNTNVSEQYITIIIKFGAPLIVGL